MDKHRTRTAVLAGVAGYVPPGTVTNADLEARLDTTDEWIRSRTGIAERHTVPPGTATRELAVEAGQLALKSAGRDSVDSVVLATATPDRLCPATAPEVASALGLGPIAAHDIAAVCAGFLYALSAGVGAIAAGFADHVLEEAGDFLLLPEERGAVHGSVGEQLVPQLLDRFRTTHPGVWRNTAICRTFAARPHPAGQQARPNRRPRRTHPHRCSQERRDLGH